MATGLRSAAEEASVGPSPSAEGKEEEEKLRSPRMRTKPTGTILNEYISVNEKHLVYFFKKDRASLARVEAAAPAAAAPAAAAVAAAAAAAAAATL